MKSIHLILNLVERDFNRLEGVFDHCILLRMEEKVLFPRERDKKHMTVIFKLQIITFTV